MRQAVDGERLWERMGMLDVALKFLVENLNAWLRARTGSSVGEVEASPIVDDKGAWAIKDDHLGAALINIEEERILKSHVAETTFVGGRHVVLDPALKLNLHILIGARFNKYDLALKHIGYVLTYFQSHPTFTPDTSPGLDERIEKLTVELQSLSYEQLNQVWAFVGGKQLPSVVYKVRMVSALDEEPAAILPALTRIGAKVSRT